MKKSKKILYILCGSLSVVCGVVGIFVPGIPTTPFMLLALWCFSHSWLSMHRKLANNIFIRKHVNKDGVSLSSKIFSMSLMAIMVTFSTVIYWDNRALSLSLIGVGATAFFFMIKHIKVKKNSTMEINHIELAKSSNACLSSLNRDKVLVCVNFQSEGKGQKGSSWESEKGKNLTFSFLLIPNETNAHKQFVISKMVALAIVYTLKHYSIDAKIKWPNDIYVGDKKISGILIENSLASSGNLAKMICGVGLNINQTLFYSDAPNPVSMSQLLGIDFPLKEVLQQYCNEFEKLYIPANISDTIAIDQMYWDNIYRREEFHQFIDEAGEFKGKIVDIGTCCELVVEKQDGSKAFYMFKEISYVI